MYAAKLITIIRLIVTICLLFVCSLLNVNISNFKYDIHSVVLQSSFIVALLVADRRYINKLIIIA